MKLFRPKGSSLVPAAIIALFTAWLHPVDAAVVYYDFGSGIPVDWSPNYNYNFDPFGDPGAGTYNNEDGPVQLNSADYFVTGSDGWEWLVSGFNAVTVNENDLIDGSGTWGTYGSIFDMWSTEYFAIRNGSTYGWVQVQRDAETAYTILGLAYNEGGAILAGQTTSNEEEGGGGGGGSVVPEPSAAVLLLLGLAAFARIKRLALFKLA